MAKASKIEAARTRKDQAIQRHDITVEVGSSIVIDPTGERLYVKEIKGGQITFERDEPRRATPV
jgi:hypothetical protein